MALSLIINTSEFDAINLKEKSNLDITGNRERYIEGQRIIEAQKKAEKVKRKELENNAIIKDGSIIQKKKNLGGRTKVKFRPEEIAAFLNEFGYDILLFELFWENGKDYDLNVGFAQTIEYTEGLRPEEGEKLPDFVNYVGWTFDRYELNNFIYHYGDTTDEGPAYEYVVLDLTRERVDMPTWAESLILLELRSYWYAERSTLPLRLSIYPVFLLAGDLPFDPNNPEEELQRLKELSIQQNEYQSIMFETNVGTEGESGDLGELIATVPVNFSDRSWQFNKYT